MLRLPLGTCSRKTIFKMLLLWSVSSCLLYGVFFTNVFTTNYKIAATVNLSENYFPDFPSAKKILTGRFLVDNEKCSIPDLDPWNAEVLRFLKDVPRFECHDQPYFNLTYVTNNTLIINEDVLTRRGYRIDEIYCCYQTIERVEQSRSEYNASADTGYRYSDCYKMDKSTKPNTGFVKVTCSTFRFLVTRVVYQDYHLIAYLPVPEETDGDTGSRSESELILRRKLSFWRNYSDYLNLRQGKEKTATSEGDGDDDRINQGISERGKPPNILILGLDSTSRLNFHRFMNRSMKVLRDVIKPMEMVGYTKVGENTFPNMVPMYTSFTENELEDVCLPSWSIPQDDCPYLWKRFAEENHYLTALLEDAPRFATFNFEKTGFIKPPVDMYLRPFMLSLYDHHYEHYNPEKPGCYCFQRPEEYLINYMADLASLANSRGIPFFIHLWMTELTHSEVADIQTVDSLVAQRLLQLHEDGVLENTILFVMGDHGYRFLDIRSTTSGWFEDKLPAMWIKLPETVTKANPDWLEGLQYNSKQLITPFDIHQMLREILNKYASSKPKKTSPPTSENGSSLRGRSPFRKVPPRTCEEAGIALNFCPCRLPVEYHKNRTFVKQAGEYLLQRINSELPILCSRFSGADITASATFVNFERGRVNESSRSVIGNGTENDSSSSLPELLIVNVRTTPGDFILEAQVGFNRTSGEFDRVSHILRLNGKSRSTNCLSRNQHAYEYYCYCIFDL